MEEIVESQVKMPHEYWMTSEIEKSEITRNTGDSFVQLGGHAGYSFDDITVNWGIS